jgi:hypothetical protein
MATSAAVHISPRILLPMGLAVRFSGPQSADKTQFDYPRETSASQGVGDEEFRR